MLLAHREVTPEGNVLEQALEEHLYQVGIRAGQIGKEIGLEAFMKLAGYLHDIGKADRNFQNYINNQTKGQINHSSAGGKVLNDYIDSSQKFTGVKNKKSFCYFQEILNYIILAHHGLYDEINSNSMESNTFLRLCYDEDGGYYYKEDVLPFIESFEMSLQKKGEKALTELIKTAYEEFKLIYGKIRTLSVKNTDKDRQLQEKSYYIACLTRLCLSILKEADIYDSVNAFHATKQHIWGKEERLKVWEKASERIEHMYQEYQKTSDSSKINKIRNLFADMAKDAAESCDSGIFKLELPTGAGKTKTGLRYGVTNARKYNRNRIFYITAYLSVLEQNAAEIRNIINQDDVILEHHSNVANETGSDYENKEDASEYDNQVYLRESWENLIILTTMVQFFNTLYKEKSSNVRRFCKLINSVIIIDEVQSLPLKVLSNFNLMMNFMKEIMHCNIVHCTATQPVLDNEAMRYKLYYGDEKAQKTDIVKVKSDWMECFRRVDFYNLTGKDARATLSTEQLFLRIEKELRTFDSCLVVLNTKAAVADLYDYLEENLPDTEIIYLTTNLCAAHRLEIIWNMKTKLVQNRTEQAHNKIVCISTQLIEAGVDVDFDVVFRSLAGIDSLIQCAGRCNREGKLMLNGKLAHGKLYIIRYQEEKLFHLPDIKNGIDAAEYAVRSWNERQKKDAFLIPMDELQRSYFDKYYIENRNQLDYIDSKNHTSILEELGRNQPARDAYCIAHPQKPKPVMFQAFKTAACNFELIGQDTVGVIVVYKNEELLEQLETALEEKDYEKVRKLLKQLQRYTVNMYLTPKVLPFISKSNNLKDINVYILQKEYYNGKKGVVMDQLADLII